MNKREEIVYHIEKNLIEFYNYFSLNDSVQIIENEFIIHIINTKSFWPNFIFLKENDYHKALKFLCQNKSLNGYLIINSDIVNRYQTEIQNSDFKPIARWKGMFANINDTMTIQHPGSLSIKRVENEYELDEWNNIVNAEVTKRYKIDLQILTPLINSSDIDFYIAYYDNTPVSTSLLFKYQDHAGLYLIATDREYRGNGFGTAITLKSINDGAKAGFNKFVLHATKAGEDIYRKIGFEEYSQLYIFTRL